MNRRNQRPVRFAPADQNFGTDNPRSREIHNRLVIRNATSAKISAALEPVPTVAIMTRSPCPASTRARGIDVVTRIPNRSDLKCAISGSCGLALSGFAALRAPITVPSVVTRVAFTATGPPLGEMRGISRSEGINAASQNRP